MMPEISHDHKAQLNEIRKKLILTGARESAFLTVESLFYDTLTIARCYGNNTSENELLATLKTIEMKEYKNTKEKFRKSSQREQAIRRFIHQLKTVLAACTKTSSQGQSQVCR